MSLGVLGVMVLGFGLILFLVYGVDSHHDTRDDFLWPGREYELTPPTATGIHLQRDFLDHWSSYTVAESDLNVFLDATFGGQSGKPLDSFSLRSPVDRDRFERTYAELGWVWTEGMVEYHCSASNGGGHTFYHDPSTGMTYQVSAHW